MSEPFIGEIKMFGGNFAPRGYAQCDGQLLPISQNTALFSLLGTQYGGDGRSTFGLPDLRGRAPVHQHPGPGLTSRDMGESFGSETATLQASHLPPHSHRQQASTSPASPAFGPSAAPGASATTNFYGSGSPQVAMAAAAVGSTGGGQPHDNMAPFQVLNFIIALQGIFPPRN